MRSHECENKQTIIDLICHLNLPTTLISGQKNRLPDKKKNAKRHKSTSYAGSAFIGKIYENYACNDSTIDNGVQIMLF